MSELQKSWAGDTLARLSVISQEYSLLQIRKLHDRAVINGNVTLGIDYVLKYGGWQEPVLGQLTALESKMNGFASKLQGARNKVLSHNDLAGICSGAV